MFENIVIKNINFISTPIFQELLVLWSMVKSVLKQNVVIVVILGPSAMHMHFIIAYSPACTLWNNKPPHNSQ